MSSLIPVLSAFEDTATTIRTWAQQRAESDDLLGRAPTADAPTERIAQYCTALDGTLRAYFETLWTEAYKLESAARLDTVPCEVCHATLTLEESHHSADGQPLCGHCWLSVTPPYNAEL